MSQADGASATAKSNDNIGLQVEAVAGGWREGVVVLAMVLAPIALAAILLATGLFVLACWQTVRGVAVELPTPTTIQSYGLLAYAAGSWIDVAAVWLWSSRRGLSGQVFLFRRLTWQSLAASLVGVVIALYATPIITQWLSHATGGGGPSVRINFHDPQSIAIYVVLFVITTPVSEEILYRGLLVAWLRRVGSRNSAIWLVGSLIFAANHVIPLGFVWAAAMVGLGAILFALRLRYESLAPAWLAHFLFNAQPFLMLPMINWLAPALVPGHLS
jgi:membrane protease YdiL (CAAX protease family)